MALAQHAWVNKQNADGINIENEGKLFQECHRFPTKGINVCSCYMGEGLISFLNCQVPLLVNKCLLGEWRDSMSWRSQSHCSGVGWKD